MQKLSLCSHLEFLKLSNSIDRPEGWILKLELILQLILLSVDQLRACSFSTKSPSVYGFVNPIDQPLILILNIDPSGRSILQLVNTTRSLNQIFDFLVNLFLNDLIFFGHFEMVKWVNLHNLESLAL